MELYLQPFLELCFPEIYSEIDWSKPPEFLDQELQEIVRDASNGKMRVDKLIKVHKLNGRVGWILLHFEVQAHPDIQLPERIFRYNHRIVDRYGRRTVSIVLLADARKDWRPTEYSSALWGCEVTFHFPICKLLDFDLAELERSSNPASTVIAAHLASLVNRQNPEAQKETKWQLTRSLYEKNFSRKDIRELFRLIDWLIRLPESLEVAFRQDLVNYEQRNSMPYITSIERLGRKEGLKEGLSKGRTLGRKEALISGVIKLIKKRFGEIDATDEALIRKLPLRRLEQLLVDILDFQSSADLQTWLSRK